MSIEFQDQQDDQATEKTRPGRCIACALVGPTKDLFEIWVVEDGKPDYYVNGIPLAREVYLDALATADKDRWCPSCMDPHDDDDHPDTVEPS